METSETHMISESRNLFFSDYRLVGKFDKQCLETWLGGVNYD